MKRLSLVRRLYFRYFYKPACERALAGELIQSGFERIVSIGLGDCEQTTRILRIAAEVATQPVHFCGIDMFESAPNGIPHLKFKEAHKRLHVAGCTIKLIPGDPHYALSRVANSLTGTQLLILGSQIPSESMERAWMYVPRMLADSAVVYQQLADGQMETVDRSLVNALAASAQQNKRLAA